MAIFRKYRTAAVKLKEINTEKENLVQELQNKLKTETHARSTAQETASKLV